MAKLLRLEEFDTSMELGSLGPLGGFGINLVQGAGAPAGVVQTFEQGYQAGWDDAVQAAADEQNSFSAEFSHNLQDLGFTFHEARSHVVGSMETLLNALVETLLPQVLAETVGARILEEIQPLIESAANRPIQIVVSPDNQKLVEPLLLSNPGCPMELLQEPSLGPGQVYLRSGTLERKIDLEDVISNVKAAFSALLEDNRKVFANA